MKLDPFHQVLPVAKPHDFPLGRLRRDLKAGRKTLPLHEKAVIAGRLEVVVEAPEQKQNQSPCASQARGWEKPKGTKKNAPASQTPMIFRFDQA